MTRQAPVSFSNYESDACAIGRRWCHQDNLAASCCTIARFVRSSLMSAGSRHAAEHESHTGSLGVPQHLCNGLLHNCRARRRSQERDRSRSSEVNGTRRLRRPRSNDHRSRRPFVLTAVGFAARRVSMAWIVFSISATRIGSFGNTVRYSAAITLFGRFSSV